MPGRSVTLPDVTSIAASVIAAALVLVAGSFLNRRWAPATQVSLSALNLHMQTLESERNECKAQIAAQAAQIGTLQATIDDLRGQVLNLTAEVLELRRGNGSTARRSPHA